MVCISVALAALPKCCSFFSFFLVFLLCGQHVPRIHMYSSAHAFLISAPFPARRPPSPFLLLQLTVLSCTEGCLEEKKRKKKLLHGDASGRINIELHDLFAVNFLACMNGVSRIYNMLSFLQSLFCTIPYCVICAHVSPFQGIQRVGN